MIDAQQWSGHGFLLEDVDKDREKGIALANADGDAPDAEEDIVFYENPGLAAVTATLTRTKHVIYKGPEFFAKPQLAAAGPCLGAGRSDALRVSVDGRDPGVVGNGGGRQRLAWAPRR